MSAAPMAAPRGDPAKGRASMRPSGVLTLVAVAVVVLLVSLPRLRGLALRENQGDARALVARVAEIVARSPGGSAPPIQELLESHPSMRRQLLDAEFLDGGRVLRRHGYLFDVVALPGNPAVRAWPVRYGQSGIAAFAWSPQTGLIGHPNQGGRWSEGEPPRVPGDPGFEAAGWRRLRRGE